MGGAPLAEAPGLAFNHSSAYRMRRFFNWFPLGLSYAFLYMGRYNLTVAKNSLADLMTKEDFGIIFGVGTMVYAFSFLINGPITDRMGGRRAILTALTGSFLMNLLMAGFLYRAINMDAGTSHMTLIFSVLYALNMYFQSFGAVAIVKVNSHWFHVKERGGFSGIFGTMISSGIFFAFTVNEWILKQATEISSGPAQWVVFFAPAALLCAMLILEALILRDRPSQAGHADFDTGDASSGEDDKPLPTLELFKRLFKNPIILTLAFIEFCTGVVRNGVMHWFPIYAKEVWSLPENHMLMAGSWDAMWIIGVCFGAGILSFFMASRTKTAARGYLTVFGALALLAPFVQGGWGGLLFVAGVIGANAAGWVSDLFFQSRRAPAAGGLFAVLAIAMLGMFFTLGTSTHTVAWVDPSAVEKGLSLQPGDTILAVNGEAIKEGDWRQVAKAVQCVAPIACKQKIGETEGIVWDQNKCQCTANPTPDNPAFVPGAGVIAFGVRRAGAEVVLSVPDPAKEQRAGDQRRIKAGPELSTSPWMLGGIMFLVSICVIGTHGLLSGTATMDFGGRKAAATAVGVIDGFVYLGTALQSFALGYLTTKSWTYWPMFLMPFAILGFVLCTRIWNAKPGKAGAH
jgi:OPA family glycerol-3-phosphate transporter-like MFS transporter